MCIRVWITRLARDAGVVLDWSEAPWRHKRGWVYSLRRYYAAGLVLMALLLIVEFLLFRP